MYTKQVCGQSMFARVELEAHNSLALAEVPVRDDCPAMPDNCEVRDRGHRGWPRIDDNDLWRTGGIGIADGVATVGDEAGSTATTAATTTVVGAKGIRLSCTTCAPA